jgi:hypothetical protein
MQHRCSLVSLPAIFAVLAMSAYAASPGTPSAQERKQQPKSESQQKETALTGCVDEKAGQYVLTNDRNLTTIANLEADGFPTEGFAKHLGHKVTVRGTSNSTGAVPTFKVRSIETVSNSCGPNQ